jgi:RNA polymerase sigma factor (sigma-70 family)
LEPNFQEITKDSFEEILFTYQNIIFKYCFQMLRNKEDAEEAIQEIFLKLYINIDRYKTGYSPKYLLYRIAHNYCINILKRKKLFNFIGIHEKYRDIVDNLKTNLKNGEILFFLPTEAYELGFGASRIQQTKYNSIDELKKNVSMDFKLPETLPEGISFESAEVWYKLDIDYRNERDKYNKLTQELYNEAKSTNKDYAYRIIKASTHIDHIYLNYKYSENAGFNLEISKNKYLSYYDFDPNSAKKIKIHKSDAIYDFSNPTNLSIILPDTIADKENPIIYRVYGFQANLKDSVIEMLKNLK